MLGPEQQEIITPEIVAKGVANNSGNGEYDHLFDSGVELSQNSVEAARVSEVSNPTDVGLSQEDRERIDAGLRTQIHQPALTPKDITLLQAQRGQPLTKEQISGMNDARASGKHLSIV